MKVFISADIEGINGIVDWKETEPGNNDYEMFRHQMTEEVKCACVGAHNAGADLIFVKDAHDNARNIIPSLLPDYVVLHRGWQGCPASMMAGLTNDFDAVIFIGYHSPSRSNGNSLSHTMNTHLHHVKINGTIASEFVINSYYASLLNVPTAFVSGDEALCMQVKEINDQIEVVATKKGIGGAVVSLHPNLTNKQIEEGVYKALSKKLDQNIVSLPRSFDIEIQYKSWIDAYRNSFFPGCKLVGNDRVFYHTEAYYDALVMMKFCL